MFCNGGDCIGFKSRANKKRKAVAKKKAREEALQNQPDDEFERICFVTAIVHSWNKKVRGFESVGSCITDSQVFARVWNRLYKKRKEPKAYPVCTDLFAFSQTNGQEVSLWHKGYDGDDPNFPEPRSNPRYYGKQPTGYDGHIIVKTPNFYVDMTLGQINRKDSKGRDLIKVPEAWVFKNTEVRSLSEYPEDLVKHITSTRMMTLRETEKPKVGESKAQMKTLRTWEEPFTLLREASRKPDAIYIGSFGIGNLEDEDTIVGYALRTDIDFETELALHRSYFADGDQWDAGIRMAVRMIMKAHKYGAIDDKGVLDAEIRGGQVVIRRQR